MNHLFSCCTRIEAKNKFIGRERELKLIFNSLDTSATGQLQNVSIVGPKRIGRSSLLLHVSQIYPNYLENSRQYVFVYIDLRSAKYHTLQNLLTNMIMDLKEMVDEKAGIFASYSTEASSYLGLSTDLSDALQKGAIELIDFQFLFEDIKRNGLYPIFCLDEFECLAEYRGKFPSSLYDCWKSLMEDNAIAFVIGSVEELQTLADRNRIVSAFFSPFSEFVSLREFSHKEAKALVELGTLCDYPFDGNDKQRAIDWAGYHPLKLQLACIHIYDTKKASSQSDENRNIDWHIQEQYYQRKLRKRIRKESKIQLLVSDISTPLAGIGEWSQIILDRDSNRRSQIFMGCTVVIIAIFLAVLIWFKGIEFIGTIISLITNG